MRHVLAASILAALLVAPFSADAKDPVFVTAKPVADRPAVTLDPSLGYVFFRSDVVTPIHLMRIASTEDQKVYEGMRAEALAKERKKYPGRLAAYKQDLQTYEILKKGGGSAKLPVPPIEPTEENFVYPAFGLLAGASIGPFNRFAKGDGGRSTYLESITPGTYRIYGLLSVVPGAAAGGTCFCMGSVMFTVKAGEVTDLGTIEAGTLLPAGHDVERDSRLIEAKILPARYVAVGKLPNYFGVTLGRMPPIPGVLEYDRDRIIDLTAEPSVSEKTPEMVSSP